MVTTILSRRTRAAAKTLTNQQLAEERDYCYRLALTWAGITGGALQANKYFEAVRFYERLLDKRMAHNA